MLLHKQEFPKEGELVLCKVTKVMYNSVFVDILEYSRQGMIHISEVSPGRIRNINDFVKEGKQIVCKVLKINEERGHIDLSLRRVNDNQKRKKMDIIKQEQKAEKIIEDTAKELKIDIKLFYKKVSKIPIEEDGFVYPSFEAVIEEDYDLTNLNLDPKELKLLIKIIKERIKPKQVEIIGNLILKSYEPNGSDDIKDILLVIGKIKPDQTKISYLGSGKFKLRIIAHDYQDAESILKNGLDLAEKYCKKHKIEFDFQRINKK